jgi:hypothetical protein
MALGLVDPLAAYFFSQWDIGRGTVTLVNGLVCMPLLIVFLAAAFPRARYVYGAALMATFLFVLSLLVSHGPSDIGLSSPIPGAAPGGVARSLFAPFLILLYPLYALLGGIAARISRRRRVVREISADCCRKCEYPLIGLTERRCPECGEPY